MSTPYPRVGVGVILINGQGQVLLGKRKGSHAPYWSIAGGHLELGETFESAAIREVDGEPQLLEPEKCEGWIWCDPHTLPEPHFDASRQSIACWLAGQCYLPQAQPAP